jgi:hypothetical protein
MEDAERSVAAGAMARMRGDGPLVAMMPENAPWSAMEVLRA